MGHGAARLNQRHAVFLTLGSSVLFGTSGTAQALGPHFTPILTSAARLGVGALLLVVMLPLFGQHPKDLPRHFTNPLTWLGAGCICVFQFGYFYSAQRAGVALGALVTMGTIPLLTGLAGSVLGHRMTAMWGVATVICALGLTLLGYQGVHGGDSYGVAAAVVAATAGAGFNLSVKQMIDLGAQPDLAQTALFLLAGLVMTGVAVATQPVHVLVTVPGAALAAWLGLVTMALPNFLWVRGLGVLSPGVTATLLVGEPLTATLLGVGILQERLSPAGMAGIALVAAGLIALGFSAASSQTLAMHD